MREGRTLWLLYGVNFLNAVGGWFFLPLLPIFLTRRGGSAVLVGVVAAAGLIANAMVRFPAGWVADRVGTRMVLVGSMLANAGLFLAYLLPVPAPAFIAVRFLHGGAQGAFWPAANGLIAEVAPSGKRGRAFGYMQSTNMAGMLIGPAVGGFIALFNLGVAFTIAAALSAVTVIPLSRLPTVHAEGTVELPARATHIARKLLPLLLFGAGTSYMIGSFDTIWALYLTYRGASTFAVGLSFAAFALPAMFFSVYAGTWGDRVGPRRFIVGGLLCTGLFAAIYPFVTSVPWLVGLGLVEGVFTISGVPSLMSEVSRVSEPGQYARTQAVFQTVGTAVQIVGALVAGALFVAGPAYAFLAITVVCFAGAATSLVPLPPSRPVGDTA